MIHTNSRHFSLLVFMAMLLAVGATVSYAVAAARLVYNAQYDCGPNRNKFKILSCDGENCQLFYVNTGLTGGGYKLKTAQSVVQRAVNEGCKVPGQRAVAQNGQGELAQLRAQVARQKAETARLGVLIAQANARNAHRVKPGGAVFRGPYICSAYSGGYNQVRAGENFTITGGSTYTDAGGHAGTYRMNGDIITFNGNTGIGGHRAQYTQGVAHSANPPHVKFLMADGHTNDTCQPK